MSLINIYYVIKPLIPRSIQIKTRRHIARLRRKKSQGTWPILEKAGAMPEGWNGWPGNKKFALSIIHDVDTVYGLANCLKLMELDRQLGIKSSFNFIAEDYWSPPWFRQIMIDNGFEVGLHGLTHDGRTFLTRRKFNKNYKRIQSYLLNWQVAGFVAPSMICNQQWLAELEIEWACSSFDTDPFEPQRQDVQTIFPFFVDNKNNQTGYVELPYTLPQDHCLYIILKERDNRIWKEKLDWIASKGGMALLNVHPDYISLDGETGVEKYPMQHYIDFIDYIKGKYSGQYWMALPREIAHFWQQNYVVEAEKLLSNRKERLHPERDFLAEKEPKSISVPSCRIWIDLDNTPHVPFFLPIIRELRKRGHEVILSARDAFQVCDLADKKGLSYACIGKHYGKNPLKKVIGLFWRGCQLFPFAKKNKPSLALSHGARSQILIANILGIPTILLTDYEHSQTIYPARAHWLIVPEILMGQVKKFRTNRIHYYRGIKEEVYVSDFEPNPGLALALGLKEDEIIITVRPPAEEAHYYNPESTKLFIELMERIAETEGVRAVLLPRHKIQEQRLRRTYPHWFIDDKVIVPSEALDGLQVLWLSDLVVSGGGTMNREAAALGVPVFSIFRGKTGKVDKMLESQGRLVLIKNKDEIWNKISFVRRKKNECFKKELKPALEDIINSIEDIIRVSAESGKLK